MLQWHELSNDGSSKNARDDEMLDVALRNFCCSALVVASLRGGCFCALHRGDGAIQEDLSSRQCNYLTTKREYIGKQSEPALIAIVNLQQMQDFLLACRC